MESPLPQFESSRLETLRSLRILETPPEDAFEDIVHLAAIICDTPIVKIGFVDQQRVWLKAKVGLEFDEIPRERSFSTHAILQPDILLVPDPTEDPRFRDNLLVTEIGVRFFAAAPLITSDHQTIGALSVMDRLPHLLTTEQMDSLRILARRIMYELEQRGIRDAPAGHPGIHFAVTRLPSATILLIEDDQMMRDLLQRTLVRVGLTVLCASDGNEALDLCRQHLGAIDLVVSDIVMPGLNGIECAERILVARPETKFLFITGFGGQFPELGALVKSGASLLEKPFLPSELVLRVRDTLNWGKLATGTEG
jgi:CheY-like chemotaxis protein